ncbi:MAG: sodium:solute symporter [Deltaproteobacteria bacterium]|jgi:SSS family solute:Na+ symporter
MESTTATLATLDAGIVIGFLLTVTVIGYALSKAASGGLEDYFLGGRKIPWYVLGISTATSNFDMAGTMIIVAMVFTLGYKGFLVEIRGGVGLSLAFLMVFLGKWLRRSRVMTSAEWMKLRFGTDRQGRSAHLLSAIANIVLSVGMIIYFSKGAGKFLTHFIPLSEVTCTSIMVGVGLFYTLLSGLYGVVFTDVVQMVLLTFTAIFISWKAYFITDDVVFPAGFFALDVNAPTELAAPLLAKDASTWEPIIGLFGLCVFMWVVRTVMEGCGGIGGYTDQRFFAARSEREASLLTLESIILSVFRWTMVAGLVVMGYSLVQAGGAHAEAIQADPEQVLPIVLGKLLPTGIKGIVLAGLIAAAMSTFDSTLNAGASYIVKDVYESYINPNATQKQLLDVSRWATIALCVVGVALAAVVPNINRIWGLITMGIGAGLFVPLVLRWYWPRFNGYGFAAGTAAGMAAGMILNGALALPLYIAFPSTVASSLVVSLVVTFMTPAVAEETLVRFCVQINPFGWGRINRIAQKTGKLAADDMSARKDEKKRDAIGVVFAVPFQLSLLISGMALIFHDFEKLGVTLFIAGISTVGLYFFWFTNLKSEEACAEEDEVYDAA